MQRKYWQLIHKLFTFNLAFLPYLNLQRIENIKAKEAEHRKVDFYHS